MPAISIIIPVYNAECYLRHCIESVIAQTYEDWETILVNDGSKDGSLTICQEYALKDNRIKVIDKPNGGPSSARNRGLNEAKGEYVYFIDADDWVESKFIENFVRNVRIKNLPHYETKLHFNTEETYDVVFHGFVREFPDGRKEKSFAMDADTSTMSKEEIICSLYKERLYGWSCCKVFRRDIIEKYNIRFDESLRLWEDELFTSEFMKHVNTIRVININPYHYLYHNQSIMHTNDKRYEKVFLSAKMNEALMPIANEELRKYLNENYNRELKYALLMALKNEPYYQCDNQTKEAILDIYYFRCNEFPELRKYNIFNSRIVYYIVEAVLQSKCKRFIRFFLSKI